MLRYKPVLGEGLVGSLTWRQYLKEVGQSGPRLKYVAKSTGRFILFTLKGEYICFQIYVLNVLTKLRDV